MKKSIFKSHVYYAFSFNFPRSTTRVVLFNLFFFHRSAQPGVVFPAPSLAQKLFQRTVFHLGKSFYVCATASSPPVQFFSCEIFFPFLISSASGHRLRFSDFVSAPVRTQFLAAAKRPPLAPCQICSVVSIVSVLRSGRF
jgi:hypothetical protein